MYDRSASFPVILFRLAILVWVALLLVSALRSYLPFSVYLESSSIPDPIPDLIPGSIRGAVDGWVAQCQDRLFTLRMAFSDWLRSGLRHMNSQALLPALLVGDRQYLLPEHWAVLSRTGTSHLMAISGLHVGMVWGALFLLFKRFNRTAAPWVAWVGALGYSLLAGFSLPTQRAFLMLTVATWAMVSRRLIRPFDGWLLAMLAVLLWDTASALSISFWLSFMAVAFLLFIGVGRLREDALQKGRSLSKWSLWVKCQLAITLGLAPLVGFAFDQVSWIAPLVNLLAVPVVTLLLLPLLLLALLLHVMDLVLISPLPVLVLEVLWAQGLGLLLSLISLLADGYWLLLKWVAGLPKIVVPFEGVVERHFFQGYCLMAYLALWAGLMPRPLPGRPLLLLGALPLMLMSASAVLGLR